MHFLKIHLHTSKLSRVSDTDSVRLRNDGLLNILGSFLLWICIPTTFGVSLWTKVRALTGIIVVAAIAAVSVAELLIENYAFKLEDVNRVRGC